MTPQSPSCECFDGPLNAERYVETVLGEDARGEASLFQCRSCGAHWLKYLIEEPEYTASGRWWEAPVAPQDVAGLSAANAKAYIEKSTWCFVGGSYFSGKVSKVDAPIEVS